MSSKKNIIYNKNHNCFGLSANAILSRQIPEKIEFIWNQAGIATLKNNDIIRLTPYYESLEDHLKRVANIDMYRFHFDNFDALHRQCVDIIKEATSFIICLDVYELPYNIYYKERHSLHYIEVVGIKDDYYFICDHFYKYKGKINKETISNAIISLINQKMLNKFEMYTFNIGNVDLSNSLDIKNILKINAMINIGEMLPGINILKHEEKSYAIGLNHFLDFKEYVSNEVLINKKNISIAYRNLYVFGSSRNNYANYLKGFLNNYSVLENIIETYEDIAQEFKIVANHILKLYFTDLKKDTQKNLTNRLQKVYLLEKEATDSIFKFLNKL